MDKSIAQLLLQDRKIAYAITDQDLKIVETGGAIDIFYCPENKNLIGCSLLELVPELIGSEAVLDDILAGDIPFFELAWINRETTQGQVIYLTLVDRPYQDSTGKITGLIHMAQDVTEMGAIDQQLAQHRNELRLLQGQLTRQNVNLATANAKLQQLDEIKSTFISVAAHELQSPITAIHGFVELLLDPNIGEPLTDKQHNYLDVVLKNTYRLVNIIKGLLDITRIEGGQMELILGRVDLGELLTNIMAEYGPQLKKKRQQLVLNIQPNLPIVVCDKLRTREIIDNLISNACKYTPEEGLITVSLTPAKEKDFLQLSIADNGVGIPPEDQPQLFEKFFRAKNAYQTKATGTGLGLFIVHSLVELQGGQIWFESTVNKGSTFYVTFPIAKIQAIV